MGMVCAVTFSPNGQLHYADPGELRPAVGDNVLLPTDGDPVAAQVVWAAEYVSDETDGFPKIIGPATEDDLAETERIRKLKAKTLVATRKLVREHGLDMKVLAVDPRRDRDRIVIYYSAPAKVDFRALLRDLSATLGSRVELTHLPERDAVKVTGTIGNCGRDTCCSTFLKDYEPVTLAMVRDQDLPTNPLRISGACGRLMCCLKYEHPLYLKFRKDAPAVGSAVETAQGPGTVIGHSVPRDAVVVKLSADGSTAVCPKASVCSARAAYDSRG